VLYGTVAVLSFAVVSAGCSLEETLSSFDLEPPAELRDLGPPQRVFAKRFVTPIRDAPSSEGARLGYLRAGTLLHSTTTEPVGYEGCEGGWYELDTGGYACHGRDILVFSGERLPELRARYGYATVRQKTPLYKRLPNADEIYVIPEEVRDAGVEPLAPEQPEQPTEIDNPLVLRVLRPGFYVSLDRTFEKDDETYWRTQQNGFVPASRIRQKEWSAFQGQVLDGQRWDLPVAVTRGEETPVYRLSDRDKLRVTRERLQQRSWVAVHSRRRIGESVYLAAGEGRLIREADVLVIQPTAPPAEVGEGERWIDVDLTHQVLVAYEWKQPRYVTLVSTGRTKTPSPELNYRTPKGLHRIYSLEDVPYVMYFRGAYAFHSAFWHDRFGRPRSHGCINLAPHDAKWLYNWAGPDLPESWHGGSATDENPGTWVWVHGVTSPALP
jgi:hypothetical protein